MRTKITTKTRVTTIELDAVAVFFPNDFKNKKSPDVLRAELQQCLKDLKHEARYFFD